MNNYDFRSFDWCYLRLGDKILGAFLIALFPFTFLLWHVYILWKHFFSAAAVPKASLVYSEDMKGEKDVLNGGE